MGDFGGDYLIGPIHPEELTNVTGGTVFFKRFSQIGANSLVFPNLTIGEGAVVGACSMERHSIPEWEIHCGCPAKFLKKRSKGVVGLVENTYKQINITSQLMKKSIIEKGYVFDSNLPDPIVNQIFPNASYKATKLVELYFDAKYNYLFIEYPSETDYTAEIVAIRIIVKKSEDHEQFEELSKRPIVLFHSICPDNMHGKFVFDGIYKVVSNNSNGDLLPSETLVQLKQIGTLFEW